VLRLAVRQGEMRLIAFLTEPASIRTLLDYLAEPPIRRCSPRARPSTENGRLDALFIADTFVLA